MTTQANHLIPAFTQITETQTLLLRASLWSDERAIEAWQAWIERVDIEHLDSGSDRLLPLLYRNLSRLGVQHPAMTKLKGTYRHTWINNQLRFSRLVSTLELLDRAGISATLLKGVGLSIVDYQDIGVRQMLDIDIWVHPVQVRAAIALLLQNGWRSREHNPHLIHRSVALRHALSFVDHESWGLDLHWRVFTRSATRVNHIDLWNDRVPIDFLGVSTYALEPTDRFLHVCAHGYGWNPTPTFRWIADAYTIWQSHKDQFNWERLKLNSIRLNLSKPAYDSLTLLENIFKLELPSSVIHALSNSILTLGKSQLYFYQISSLPPEVRFVKGLSATISFQYFMFKATFDVFKEFHSITSNKSKGLLSFLVLSLICEVSIKRVILIIKRSFYVLNVMMKRAVAQ